MTQINSKRLRDVMNSMRQAIYGGDMFSFYAAPDIYILIVIHENLVFTNGIQHTAAIGNATASLRRRCGFKI